ncbi:sensor histidine kinase [Alishewanella longhuensis]
MEHPQSIKRHELQLPDLTQAAHLLRVVVFSQALALLLALAPNTEQAFWVRLGLVSILVHWISLVSCLLFTRLKPRLRYLSIPKLALAVQVILLGVTLLCSMFSYKVLADAKLSTAYINFHVNNLIIAFIVGLVLIQFLIMYDELANSINAQHQARFSALQARIRPHFLFNSLNTVAELIHSDQTAAEQALLNLADLFRAAMASTERIPLAEELALCQQYLSLEQWRLGNKLNINWQVPDALPAVALPALTIQPLLENAIQYGFETRTSAGTLDVIAYLGKKQLSIVIENPITTSTKTSRHNGIAIANIRQRLQLCFGQQAQLTTFQQEQSYRVKLVLPLEQT